MTKRAEEHRKLVELRKGDKIIKKACQQAGLDYKGKDSFYCLGLPWDFHPYIKYVK